MQMEEDVNAMDMNMSVATERSVAKSKKGVYSNSSWDLIDAVDEGRKDIGEPELSATNGCIVLNVNYLRGRTTIVIYYRYAIRPRI